MFFRNAALWVLEKAIDPSALNAALEQRPLQLPGNQQPGSVGWIPVSPEGHLAYSTDVGTLIRLGMHERLITAAVINRAASERAAEFERQRGFKPGRKLMREIKDAVLAELLPRAFIQDRQVTALIMGRVLVVDTPNKTAAELVVQVLRDCLGSLPAVPMTTIAEPSAVMTSWLMANEAPEKFEFSDELRIHGIDQNRPTARFTRDNPSDLREGVRELLDMGRRVDQLRVTWDGMVTATITDPLGLRRIRWPEVDEAERIDDPMEAFQADHELQARTLKRLLADIEQKFMGFCE